MTKINVLEQMNVRDKKFIKEYYDLIKKVEFDMAQRDQLIKELTIIKPTLVWHGCPTEFAERIKDDIAQGLITTVDGKKNVHQITHEYCRILNFVSTKEKNKDNEVFITEQSMQSYMRRDTGATFKKKILMILLFAIQKLSILSTYLIDD